MLMPALINFWSRLAVFFHPLNTLSYTLLCQAPDSDIAEAVRERRGLPLRHPGRAAERQKQRELEEQQWQQPQQQPGNNGAPARNMREAQLRQQQQWAQQHVQEQQQLQQQRDAEAQVAAGESYDELRKRNRTAPGYSVAPSQAGLPAHPTVMELFSVSEKCSCENSNIFQEESTLFQQLNIPPPVPSAPPAPPRQGNTSNKYGDEGFE